MSAAEVFDQGNWGSAGLLGVGDRSRRRAPASGGATRGSLTVVDQAMVTAIARRRDHARVAVRARDRAVLARTCVLTSMVAVMSTAVGTMAWAFLSVPNLP